MRRLTQVLSPWVSENPLFVHATNTSTAGIKAAVDQLSEVGLEMVIQSFGTSFHMEDASPVCTPIHMMHKFLQYLLK